MKIQFTVDPDNIVAFSEILESEKLKNEIVGTTEDDYIQKLTEYILITDQERFTLHFKKLLYELLLVQLMIQLLISKLLFLFTKNKTAVSQPLFVGFVLTYYNNTWQKTYQLTKIV
jgi:hypothetical protein